MTITTTITDRSAWGDKRVVYGKSVLSDAATGGDVITSLSRVEHFMVNVQGGTQKGCSVDEDLPLAGGDVTVEVETANGTFYWMAIGR